MKKELSIDGLLKGLYFTSSRGPPLLMSQSLHTPRIVHTYGRANMIAGRAR